MKWTEWLEFSRPCYLYHQHSFWISFSDEYFWVQNVLQLINLGHRVSICIFVCTSGFTISLKMKIAFHLSFQKIDTMCSHFSHFTAAVGSSQNPRTNWPISNYQICCVVHALPNIFHLMFLFCVSIVYKNSKMNKYFTSALNSWFLSEYRHRFSGAENLS